MGGWGTKMRVMPSFRSSILWCWGRQSDGSAYDEVLAQERTVYSLAREEQEGRQVIEGEQSTATLEMWERVADRTADRALAEVREAETAARQAGASPNGAVWGGGHGRGRVIGSGKGIWWSGMACGGGGKVTDGGWELMFCHWGYLKAYQVAWCPDVSGLICGLAPSPAPSLSPMSDVSHSKHNLR